MTTSVPRSGPLDRRTWTRRATSVRVSVAPPAVPPGHELFQPPPRSVPSSRAGEARLTAGSAALADGEMTRARRLVTTSEDRRVPPAASDDSLFERPTAVEQSVAREAASEPPLASEQPTVSEPPTVSEESVARDVAPKRSVVQRSVPESPTVSEESLTRDVASDRTTVSAESVARDVAPERSVFQRPGPERPTVSDRPLASAQPAEPERSVFQRPVPEPSAESDRTTVSAQPATSDRSAMPDRSVFQRSQSEPPAESDLPPATAQPAMSDLRRASAQPASDRPAASAPPAVPDRSTASERSVFQRPVPEQPAMSDLSPASAQSATSDVATVSERSVFRRSQSEPSAEFELPPASAQSAMSDMPLASVQPAMSDRSAVPDRAPAEWSPAERSPAQRSMPEEAPRSPAEPSVSERPVSPPELAVAARWRHQRVAALRALRHGRPPSRALSARAPTPARPIPTVGRWLDYGVRWRRRIDDAVDGVGSGASPLASAQPAPFGGRRGHKHTGIVAAGHLQRAADAAAVAAIPRPHDEPPDRRPFASARPTHFDGRRGHKRAERAEPPLSPADAFVAELQRHRATRPRPLPVQFRPMATVIVGERPVHVSTDVASRRALQRVGKRAATTGGTIHLDTDRPSPEIVAHELTHVAHPSPEPRFFADDRPSPEERRAEQVAAVMRRTPILPRTSGAGAAGALPSVAPAHGGGRSHQPVIQRSPNGSRGRSGARAADTVSAAALAASITGPPDTVQRLVIGGHRARSAATAATMTPTAPPQSSTATAPYTPPVPSAPPMEPPAPTTTEMLSQFDRILELLEDRIVAELERRGGRFRGGF